MKPEKSRRILLADLREKLIPWAKQHGIKQLVLAKPPITAPEPVKVWHHEGSPLQILENQPIQDRLQTWRDSHMLASRSPRLCCVIQGEIDWRIGITSEMAHTLEGEGAQSDFHVVSMPKGTFFLIPPGVPYSDGRYPHWERENQDQEESLVFWLQILPHGVFCHRCCSAHSIHTNLTPIYLIGNTPGILVRELLELVSSTMRQKDEQTAQSLLVDIFRYVERALSAQHIPQVEFTNALLGTEPIEFTMPGNMSPILQRASEFISINLHHSIELPQIAQYAGTSPTHLNRCFQSECNRSVMQFVRERRVQIAKALLRDSELSMQDIGELVGYPNQSHFARLFKQMQGTSPLQYRTFARQTDKE